MRFPIFNNKYLLLTHILNCYQLCKINGVNICKANILFLSIFLYILTAICDILIVLNFSFSNDILQENIQFALFLYLLRSILYCSAPISGYYFSFKLLSNMRKVISKSIINKSIPLYTEIKSVYISKLQDLCDKYIINAIKITGETISVFCYGLIIIIYLFTNNLILKSLFPFVIIISSLIIIAKFLSIQGKAIDQEISKLMRSSFLLSNLSRTFNNSDTLLNKNPFNAIKNFSKYLSRYYSASIVSRVIIEFISVIFVFFLIFDGSVANNDLLAIFYAGSRLLLSLVTFSSTFASVEYAKPLYDSVLESLLNLINNSSETYFPITKKAKLIQKQLYNRIKTLLVKKSDNSPTILLTGNSGSGKSTLVSNIYGKFKNKKSIFYISSEILSVDLKLEEYLELYNLNIQKLLSHSKNLSLPPSLRKYSYT